MGKRGTAATQAQPSAPPKRRKATKEPAAAKSAAAPAAAKATPAATAPPAGGDFNFGYYQKVQDAISAICATKTFEDIRTAEPLTMDPNLPEHCRGDQAPFEKEQYDQLMTTENASYKAGCNVFWVDLFRTPARNVPYNPGQVEKLKQHFFKDCSDQNHLLHSSFVPFPWHEFAVATQSCTNRRAVRLSDEMLGVLLVGYFRRSELSCPWSETPFSSHQNSTNKLPKMGQAMLARVIFLGLPGPPFGGLVASASVRPGHDKRPRADRAPRAASWNSESLV